MFQFHKSLGARHEYLRQQAARAAPADPENERQLSKQHFERLQAGREQADDKVWANAKREDPANLLKTEPTPEEIHACGRQMRNEEAAGGDGFLAEFFRYGSDLLKKQIQGIVQVMWRQATGALPGREVYDWPEAWSKGIVAPLWKKKGDRSDKSTYRGITLQSVGSKLLARVVAQRIQQWSEPWLAEQQAGFGKGRGVDDVMQVTGRIVEEATVSHPRPEVVLIRLFDIEKAYPRASRDSLRQLMEVKGAPVGFIQICKGLREYTSYQVRIHGGLSPEYTVDNGLREGRPSSPRYLMCIIVQL